MSGRGRSYIWFLAGLAAIVVGFWPSFYGDPLSNDAWHIVHGVAATLWVSLLIAQSLLIGRGNRQLHERLGWLSSGLFATLFVTTSYMIWLELTGPEPFPAVIRQELLFLDITFLLLFIAVYLAWHRRPAHAAVARPPYGFHHLDRIRSGTRPSLRPAYSASEGAVWRIVPDNVDDRRDIGYRDFACYPSRSDRSTVPCAVSRVRHHPVGHELVNRTGVCEPASCCRRADIIHCCC